MDRGLDRVPPQNIDAEQSLLGAILLEPQSIFEVLDLLDPADFYRDGHRMIYEAMMDLNESDQDLDLVTVTEELRRRGELDKIGGAVYIGQLANFVPTAANIDQYARIICEKSMLRSLITVASRISNMGYEGEEAADNLLANAEHMILELGGKRLQTALSSIRDILLETLEYLENMHQNKDQLPGVTTGFQDLDDICSGLQPSDLVIVAARPSMGKTTLGLNIAEHVALKHSGTVAIFSLEMSKDQLVRRMLCTEAMVDQHKARRGDLDEEDWTRIMEVAAKFSETKIFIDDTPAITVSAMRGKVKRLQAEHGLSLIIVDYLQLMQGHGRIENRQQEIAEISRSLKGLAKELNVPVVALAQLSRAVEQRQDKRPMLADLRESGSLEQDADVVMFIYRDEYYYEDSDKKGIAEIIIAKQRNGPTGKIELGFLKEFTRFVNLAHREEDE